MKGKTFKTAPTEPEKLFEITSKQNLFYNPF